MTTHMLRLARTGVAAAAVLSCIAGTAQILTTSAAYARDSLSHDSRGDRGDKGNHDRGDKGSQDRGDKSGHDRGDKSSQDRGDDSHDR